MLLNYKEIFDTIQSKLHSSALWMNMISCEEKSPHHREKNVAVHTQMVLEEYYPLIEGEWRLRDFIVSVTLLFHDCGKPSAKIEKFSEERGTYYAFYGHELQSSRLFVDFVLSNKELSLIFANLGTETFFSIAWLIEYHKPWDISDKNVRNGMMRTISRYLGDVEIFIDVLLSDSYGRISDDKISKDKKVELWVQQFRDEYVSKTHFAYLNSANTTEPKAYFLIGASGSGKSTYRNKLGVVSTFSLDDMRIELYGSDYSFSYIQSTKDKHFKAKCKERLLDLARLNKDMVMDNTNCIRNTRQFHLNELRQRHYHTVGVVFLTALHTNVERQKTRTDKCVPTKDVERQYYQTQLPSLGEFDEIVIVVDFN